MKVQALPEWDVRDGKVYRDGQAIVSFSEYRTAHPESNLTVERWEARKWQMVNTLTSGRTPK